VRCTDNGDSVEHPPLAIFYRSEGGTKLHELIIGPTPRELLPKSQSSRPHYLLENLMAGNIQLISWENDTDRDFCRSFVLPGTLRSLVYVTTSQEIEESIRIRGFYSHFPDSNSALSYRTNRKAQLQSILRDPLPKRARGMCKFDMSPDLRRNLRDRVKTVAWDEGNGRVLYVKSDDPQIHVIEFAKAPIQGTWFSCN
jgi:hypothetical protein